MKYSNAMLSGRKTTDLKMTKMIELFKENVSNAAIAERLGLTHSTICRFKKLYLKEENL